MKLKVNKTVKNILPPKFAVWEYRVKGDKDNIVMLPGKSRFITGNFDSEVEALETMDNYRRGVFANFDTHEHENGNSFLVFNNRNHATRMVTVEKYYP